MPHSGNIKKIICEELIFKSLGDIAKFLFNTISEHKNDFQINDIPFLRKYKYKDVEDLLKKGIDDLTKKMENEEKENFFYKDETVIEIHNNAIIVKFEKNFNRKDYPTINTLPKIITSVLMERMKVKNLRFEKKKIGQGLISKILNNVNFSLSEGDVINIKTNDQNVPFDHGNDIMSIIRYKFETSFFTSNVNYNFTFLIELDPL